MRSAAGRGIFILGAMGKPPLKLVVRHRAPEGIHIEISISPPSVVVPLIPPERNQEGSPDVPNRKTNEIQREDSGEDL